MLRGKSYQAQKDIVEGWAEISLNFAIIAAVLSFVLLITGWQVVIWICIASSIVGIGVRAILLSEVASIKEKAYKASGQKIDKLQTQVLDVLGSLTLTATIASPLDEAQIRAFYSTIEHMLKSVTTDEDLKSQYLHAQLFDLKSYLQAGLTDPTQVDSATVTMKCLCASFAGVLDASHAMTQGQLY